MAPAVELASDELVKRGGVPLPPVTPHGCRRTFASILSALGESPAICMQELGHTNPSMTLRVYTGVMRRDEDENRRLAALVEGGELAVIGSPVEVADSASLEREAASRKNPA